MENPLSGWNFINTLPELGVPSDRQLKTVSTVSAPQTIKTVKNPGIDCKHPAKAGC